MATGGRRGRAVPLSKSFSRRLRHGRTGFGGSGHARGMMQLHVASAPSRCRRCWPTGGEETDGARWERRSGGRRYGGSDDGDDAGAGEQGGGGGGEMSMVRYWRRSSVGAGSGSTAVDGGHGIASRPNAGASAGIARPRAISPTAVMNCNAPRAEGQCGGDGVTDGCHRGGSGEAAEEGEIEDDGAVSAGVAQQSMEMPMRTFLNWYRCADYTAYVFNTRPLACQPCQMPQVYYMRQSRLDRRRNTTVTEYERHRVAPVNCGWRIPDLATLLDRVIVLKKPDPDLWKRVIKHTP
uniref:Uncharacterized protein n=1 Tax=Oryza rufipogon TaxID=4529 RepID=A0A0E0PWS5_ORYRU